MATMSGIYHASLCTHITPPRAATVHMRVIYTHSTAGSRSGVRPSLGSYAQAGQTTDSQHVHGWSGASTRVGPHHEPHTLTPMMASFRCTPYAPDPRIPAPERSDQHRHCMCKEAITSRCDRGHRQSPRHQSHGARRARLRLPTCKATSHPMRSRPTSGLAPT